MPTTRWGAKDMPALGFELDVMMHAHRMSYSRMSCRLASRGWKVSSQFIGMLCRGTRRTGPDKLNLICDVLNVTREQRERLNQCAVHDLGWRIGWIPARPIKGIAPRKRI